MDLKKIDWTMTLVVVLSLSIIAKFTHNGFAEALVIASLLSYRGYKKYLSHRFGADAKKAELAEQFEIRLRSIESRIALGATRGR